VFLHFVESPDEIGTNWMLIERSSKGDEYDVLLPNPTAAKVGELDAFQHCYTAPPTTTEE
jgi:hypothetical protein